MDHTFDTPEPVELAIEVGPGTVAVRAVDTTKTAVRITGKDADRFVVEQHGRQISISSPRRWTVGLDLGLNSLQIEVQVPRGSDLHARFGSADLRTYGDLGNVQIKSGSGDLIVDTAGHVDISTGSGDVGVQHPGDDATIRTGSGDVAVAVASGGLSFTSGSGDLTVAQATGPVATKTGSGGVVIHELTGDATVTTASGDVTVRRMGSGAVRARTASGDITLGATSGTPVWTDATSVSGSVDSQLEHMGSPQDGQPFVEWHARSVSGSILLQHAARAQTT